MDLEALRQANAELQRAGQPLGGTIRRRFMVRFAAQDGDLEATGAATAFDRNGQLIEGRICGGAWGLKFSSLITGLRT